MCVLFAFVPGISSHWHSFLEAICLSLRTIWLLLGVDHIVGWLLGTPQALAPISQSLRFLSLPCCLPEQLCPSQSVKYVNFISLTRSRVSESVFTCETQFPLVMLSFDGVC